MLMDLPPIPFADAWRTMTPEARAQLPDDVRKAAFERFNKDDVYGGPTMARTERATAALDAHKAQQSAQHDTGATSPDADEAESVNHDEPVGVDEPADPWPSGSGSIAEYLDTPPPSHQWFARGRLLENRAHVLTGLGGTSKTTVQVHLAFGGVIGRLPWNWQIERTGSALLLLAEDDRNNLHRIIANHAQQAGLTATERQLIADRLHAYPMAGEACQLLAAGPNSTLSMTQRARGLFALARRIPDLVFIGLDPAIALTDGDEMNPAHQRRLGELADRLAIETGACVLLTSHAAKATHSADELRSHTSRGSGAITDAVRAELALRTMTANEAKKFGIETLVERMTHVQLALTKGNAAPPDAYEPVWLRRGPGGLLQPAELEVSTAGILGRRELKALAILRDLSAGSACQLKDWRAACDDADLLTGQTDEARRKSMQRILHTLAGAGRIESGMGKGVYLPVDEAQL